MAKEQSNQQIRRERKTSQANRTKTYQRGKKAEQASEKRTPAKKMTRESRAEEETKQTKKRGPAARVRVFPIWLRLLVLLALLLFALVAGVMIGFGILGDGTPLDALKVETWQHIIDIVVKE